MPEPAQSDSPYSEREFLEGLRYEDKFPEKREPRCGPWDEREDGALVCRKCGDVDFPGQVGPFGF